MKLFIDKLIDKIEIRNSRICVGLDPHPDMLPNFLVKKYTKKEGDNRKQLAKAVLEFNKNLIDSLHDITPVVKPQAAFYELLGISGLETLRETIEYAQQRGLLVILDAKRNDIGSTAAGYARAYLGAENNEGIKAGCPLDNKAEEAGLTEILKKPVRFFPEIEADCLTINPYLGYDGIEPFLRREDKGAFALLKTSNDSGKDLQDLVLEDGQKVYEKTAKLIAKWGNDSANKSSSGYSNLGAVVGATYPGELKKLREIIPKIFFLIPGFGFQGGEPGDIINGFDEEGLGAVVNSSRGINFAFRREPWRKQFGPEEYAAAARAAAINMKEEINKILK